MLQSLLAKTPDKSDSMLWSCAPAILCYIHKDCHYVYFLSITFKTNKNEAALALHRSDYLTL